MVCTSRGEARSGKSSGSLRAAYGLGHVFSGPEAWPMPGPAVIGPMLKPDYAEEPFGSATHRHNRSISLKTHPATTRFDDRI